jgi:hypothetical protein
MFASIRRSVPIFVQALARRVALTDLVPEAQFCSDTKALVLLIAPSVYPYAMLGFNTRPSAGTRWS